MALPPDEWLHLAQELEVGRRRRVDHTCGDGKTMIVDNKPDGYSAYCWRCSDQGWFKKELSIAERLERLRVQQQAEDEARVSAALPLPAIYDPREWPLEAKVWLYKAGINNDQISQYGIYYNPRLQRVVLPVMDGEKAVYWQARKIAKGGAKYLNPSINKPWFVARNSGGPMVITEDVLSAIRVGEVTSAISALGTSIQEDALPWLSGLSDHYLVWLDPDGAGRQGSTKFVQKLRAYGLAATPIRTDKDPKYYSRGEIADIVARHYPTAHPA